MLRSKVLLDEDDAEGGRALLARLFGEGPSASSATGPRRPRRSGGGRVAAAAPVRTSPGPLSPTSTGSGGAAQYPGLHRW